MTDAINFFQAFSAFNGFSSIGANRAEIRLANRLKKDARRLAAEANVEANNAEIARKIAFDAKKQIVRRSFAEIALWHSQTAFDKFNRAAARFDEAARIETKMRTEFSKTAKQAANRAAEVEITIGILIEFLSRN